MVFNTGQKPRQKDKKNADWTVSFSFFYLQTRKNWLKILHEIYLVGRGEWGHFPSSS
jgi:hypothetical protein